MDISIKKIKKLQFGGTVDTMLAAPLSYVPVTKPTLDKNIIAKAFVKEDTKLPELPELKIDPYLTSDTEETQKRYDQAINDWKAIVAKDPMLAYSPEAMKKFNEAKYYTSAGHQARLKTNQDMFEKSVEAIKDNKSSTFTAQDSTGKLYVQVIDKNSKDYGTIKPVDFITYIDEKAKGTIKDLTYAEAIQLREKVDFNLEDSKDDWFVDSADNLSDDLNERVQEFMPKGKDEQLETRATFQKLANLNISEKDIALYGLSSVTTGEFTNKGIDKTVESNLRQLNYAIDATLESLNKKTNAALNQRAYRSVVADLQNGTNTLTIPTGKGKTTYIYEQILPTDDAATIASKRANNAQFIGLATQVKRRELVTNILSTAIKTATRYEEDWSNLRTDVDIYGSGSGNTDSTRDFALNYIEGMHKIIEGVVTPGTLLPDGSMSNVDINSIVQATNPDVSATQTYLYAKVYDRTTKQTVEKVVNLPVLSFTMTDEERKKQVGYNLGQPLPIGRSVYMFGVKQNIVAGKDPNDLPIISSQAQEIVHIPNTDKVYNYEENGKVVTPEFIPAVKQKILLTRDQLMNYYGAFFPTVTSEQTVGKSGSSLSKPTKVKLGQNGEVIKQLSAAKDRFNVSVFDSGSEAVTYFKNQVLGQASDKNYADGPYSKTLKYMDNLDKYFKNDVYEVEIIIPISDLKVLEGTPRAATLEQNQSDYANQNVTTWKNQERSRERDQKTILGVLNE